MARVKTDWNKVKEDYFQDYLVTLEDVAKNHNTRKKNNILRNKQGTIRAL